ncbi:MAG: hypothetical protein ACKPCM_18785 [Pseudanabaena sp.]
MQLPQDLETEILQLGYFELTETLNEMTYSITPNGEALPNFEHLPSQRESGSYYDNLGIEHRIALIRWIAEILSTNFNAQS